MVTESTIIFDIHFNLVSSPHLKNDLSKSNITYKETLQLIFDILSFDYPISRLEAQLKSNSINWETLVKTASNHLVLTTVYCRLNQKQLLHLLPEDLNIYLSELTAINRNRNETIANEVKWIAKLLNENKIEHVFFKGAGLLLEWLLQRCW